jgi:hypothetical protein
MIPPEERLTPEERAKWRRAVIVLVGGSILGLLVALGLTLLGAGINISVLGALVVGAATGLFMAFGVFKVQEYAAEARRARRALSRGERLKQWIPAIALVGLSALVLSREQGARGFARISTILLILSILWAIVDISRGPRE